MGIADWPAGERPREKLLERGAGSLSDAELLAIFLRVGAKGKTAVDLGRDLIERFGSLNGLFAADQGAVAKTAGVGPAKTAQLKAAFELANRALHEKVTAREALASPAAVREHLRGYLRLTLANRDREVFVAVLLDAQHRVSRPRKCSRAPSPRPAFSPARSSSAPCGTTPRRSSSPKAATGEVFVVVMLDAQHRVIAVEELFAGTLTQTSVYPREVVKCVLRHNAGAVIFAQSRDWPGQPIES